MESASVPAPTHPETSRLRHALGGLVLALLPALLPGLGAAQSSAAGPICGWTIDSEPSNPLQLLPASAPPWIDPTFPCTCCVTGAKYGLGVFGAQNGASVAVFYSLGTFSAPVGSQVLMIDPTQLVGSLVLPPDPNTPNFANVCWVFDDCQTIPENPALIGLHLFLQAAGPDFSPPHAFSLSNRLDLLIGTQF